MIDLTDSRYGKLVVLRKDTEVTTGKPRWICQCDCGKVKSVAGACLRQGNVKSCGCAMAELGKSRRRYDKPMEDMSEYHSWRGMKRRCLDKNANGYSDYGGRGITIDLRWIDSFDAFYRDMGPKPGPEYSIERKNTNGNYTRGNCRWATPLEQSNNKRVCTYYTVDGAQLTLPAVARKLNLNYSRLYWHISKGLSLDDAIDKVRDKIPLTE